MTCCEEKLIDRLTEHEGEAALKGIADELKRVEASKAAALVPEPVVSAHDVDAMLHAKRHEIREVSSQLEIARVDMATANLELESAVKQRDHWRTRYETELEHLRAKQTKERENDSSEKEVLQRDNLRLQQEVGKHMHAVASLNSQLQAETARTQLMEQQIQRAPSESISILHMPPKFYIFDVIQVSRLVAHMRDQLNVKEKKLQALQSAIAMLKQELVQASQTIAEKSIRESKEISFDKSKGFVLCGIVFFY